MKITQVFPLIEEKGIHMDPDVVLRHVVNSAEYVQVQRARGIEPPLKMQHDVRSVAEQILGTQGKKDWWKSLEKKSLLRHPALEQWRENPELDKVIHRTLIEISGAAASALWNSLTGEDINEAVVKTLDEEGVAESVTIQNQHEKLAKIAARELGSEYGRSNKDAE